MTTIRLLAYWFFGLAIAFLLAVFLSGFAASWYFCTLGERKFVVSEAMVEIPFGSSLKRVSELLADAQVIKSPKLFAWYLRLGRSDGAKIQAGYYLFSGELSFQSLAERLQSGADQSFRVTFKEGQTLVDLVQSLAEVGLADEDKFIAAMTSQEILNLINPVVIGRKNLRNDVGGIEGYLFPDTYFFSKKDNAATIIKKMHAQLLTKLDFAIWQRIDELNTNLNEVLTLASIIEKETGNVNERPIISSVYRNRLAIGMRLQADPTVIYGIKNYDGKIRKADLLAYHPYNTYQIQGLPPGPISSVGLAAIRAALWPEKTKFFYFVSRNDGSHVFCADLGCHNKAVRLWQIDYFKKANASSEKTASEFKR